MTGFNNLRIWPRQRVAGLYFLMSVPSARRNLAILNSRFATFVPFLFASGLVLAGPASEVVALFFSLGVFPADLVDTDPPFFSVLVCFEIETGTSLEVDDEEASVEFVAFVDEEEASVGFGAFFDDEEAFFLERLPVDFSTDGPVKYM